MEIFKVIIKKLNRQNYNIIEKVVLSKKILNLYKTSLTYNN